MFSGSSKENSTVELSIIDPKKRLEKYREWLCSEKDSSKIVLERFLREQNITLDEDYEGLENTICSDTFAIIEKGSNELLGFAGLTGIRRMNRSGNIWLQMDPFLDYDKQIEQGKEALNKILEYSFYTKKLNNLIMEVPTYHRQVIDILKKSKMIFMARREQSALFQDDIFDSMLTFQSTPIIYSHQSFFSSYHTNEYTTSNLQNIKLNKESTMRDMIEGNDIVLLNPKRYVSTLEKMGTIPFFVSTLNNPKISIPFGISIPNWTDTAVRNQLMNRDYIIVKDKKPLGYLSLSHKNAYDRSANIEVVIGDLKEQGKGYMKEAIHLFLKEQYERGIYNSILADIFDFNQKSLNLFQKVGFQKIGERYEAHYAYEKLNNIYFYEMNRSSYQKRLK